MRRLLALAVALAVAAPALAEDPSPKPADKPAVKEKTFSPEFDGVPLADVLTWLTKEVGFEYTLTAEAQKVAKKGLAEVRVVGKDISARDVLALALTQLGLTWDEKPGGQIRILSEDEYAKDTVLSLYDVRDLLAVVTDFEGPSVGGFDVTHKDGAKGGSDVPGGPHWKDPGEKGESARPPNPVEDPDSLQALLKNGTGGDKAWVEGTSMTLVSGVLYVKAPVKLQREVRALLNKLHQYK